MVEIEEVTPGPVAEKLGDDKKEKNIGVKRDKVEKDVDNATIDTSSNGSRSVDTIAQKKVEDDIDEVELSKKYVYEMVGIKKRPWTRASVVRSVFFLSLALGLGALVNPRFAVVRPAEYDPEPIPERTGVLRSNNYLRESTNLLLGETCSPSDFLNADDGSFLIGCLDGRIIHFSEGNYISQFVDIGTALLGLCWGDNGDIFVAAGDKGLLVVHENREVDVLSSASITDGRPFKYVNSVVRSKKGQVFFTDGSHKFRHNEVHYEALELGLNGRLLVYDIRTGVTATLVDNIACAAGIVLSLEEDFLLISDAFRSQIAKLWIEGENEGKLDFVSRNLPGYPFKISPNQDGTFWVALTFRRSEAFEYLHSLPLVKTALSHLPESNWWVGKGEGWIIRISGEGEVVESLEDSSGFILKAITSAKQLGSRLYISADNFFGFISLQVAQS